MKILRFILIVGGIALIGYAVFVAYDISVTETMIWSGGRFSQQLLGMFGIGILAILAGVFMRRRP